MKSEKIPKIIGSGGGLLCPLCYAHVEVELHRYWRPMGDVYTNIECECGLKLVERPNDNSKKVQAKIITKRWNSLLKNDIK